MNASMGKPRSICIASHDPGVQGAERAMLDMAELLHNAGWHVEVLLPDEKGGLADLCDIAGINRIIIPYFYWFGPGHIRGRLYRQLRNLWSLPSLVRLFRDGGFDVIYTHSTAVGLTALAARLAEKPHVWHMHEYGPFGKGEDELISYDLGHWATRKLMGWTGSVYVAVASVIREAFQPMLAGEDIRVIYQPVPYDRQLHPDDADAITKVEACKGPKIIYVGAIIETKRHEDAIRAMPVILSKYPEARLILGGREESVYGTKIRTLAAELGVSHAVVYLGYLKNAPAVIGLCDISINCRLAEASPRVIVESMMAGTLVIAADAGGNVESLSPNTGLLYRAMKGHDLARQVVWALDHPEEVFTLVTTARENAIHERALDSYADRYVTLIEGAIDAAIERRAEEAL